MPENLTPEDRAVRALKVLKDSREPEYYPLYLAIKSEIEDAIDKTVVLKSTDVKPRHAVGVSVLLVENGKLLLGRRKGGVAEGWLSTPGGRLEFEEDVPYCAVREFWEETGARIYSDDIKVIDVRKLSRFDDHYIMFYVLATKHDGVIANMEPKKCGGWQWYAGYELAGRTDVTEPSDILKKLSLTQTPSVTDQAHIDGWNDAVNMLELTGRLDSTSAKEFRK